ncbi:IQ domain-containing protein K isoform X5 [Coturnix japonica]|uniref:IQ domain-containing protein K isoform X5 n=1 Tax=Coturnix japonica TaxID=93934 RepID=UPI0007776A99|nr:IQ domain-containing protein K isoform X5 [Coturnix japonica]
MAADGPGTWQRLCAECEAEQRLFPDIPESMWESVSIVQNLHKVSLDTGMLQPLYTEQFYPSPAADAVVQQLLPIPNADPLPQAPDPKTLFCAGSSQEYLEYYIFPVLLPGMIELLHQAKKEKCFERKRTKFIACDFLTEWLYNNNPRRKDESFTEFFSIPFVQDWLKDHPRQPFPLSFFLSEEEASIIIQAFWRGYRVRCDTEVQELREWQKQFRDEKIISETVGKFWAEQEAKAAIQRGDF